MNKSNDIQTLNYYLNKYKINDFFSSGQTPEMELFFYKKGDFICKEGQPFSHFFFFVSGKAKVYSTLSNGKALLISFYEPLQILGDLEIFNYSLAASNVQVIQDVYCIGIHIQKNKQLLLNDLIFLRCLCTELSKKLNNCSKNSTINLLYPLENKLAGYILATMDGISFKANLTETAELLGTSYRHLLRTLNQFCQNNYLIKENGVYKINDLDSISELACDLYQS